MSKNKLFLLTLLISPLSLSSVELMKDYFDYKDERPLPNVANNLIYNDGSSELTTQLSEYENVVANKPLQGSIFVTHDANNKVDVDSFRLGDKPLTVKFVQTTQMTSSSNIVVSIYSFGLPGMPVGIHTLPPINVKIGSNKVQALPLVIEVSQ
ncbi:MAG TPA: hypothetical protein VGP47_08545 [Parachlamydiaceae bacterium]|nr:hypothetical protein [Parachlamydiaceae bacterium]